MRGVRGEGSGVRRRHLSSSTRDALAHTRLIEVVPAGPSRLHSSAPPSIDEPPVVLHPRWAPAHPRRVDGSDARLPLRRTHVLHPGVAPRRGPRPGRRPRPIVPFDIPVEAFAVEVGGGAHPSVRSLGERRLVYIEHRVAVRRAYRRRQLFLALGLSGAFVAIAAVALAPGGADASPPTAADPVVAPAQARISASTLAAVPVATVRTPVRRHAVNPPARRSWRDPHVAAGRTPPGRPGPVAADRDFAHFPAPYVIGYRGRPLADDPFLVCTRGYESANAGDYGAKSPGGRYRGAYQFDRDTWNGVARYLGRVDLVGVDPALAPPYVQDLLAYSLYTWQGARHWHNRCAGLA